MPSKCVVCGIPITFQFSLCRKCEDIYGRRVADWDDWLRFLVNDSRRERRRIRRDNSKLVPMDSNTDGFSMMNVEELVIAKMSVAYYFTTDGEEIELKDSDWEAVYDWS